VIDLDRVVYHEVHWHQRVHHLRVLAEPLGDASHRCQVDHKGDAGEVLEEHPRRVESDLLDRRRREAPVAEGPHLLLGDDALPEVPV
jgi:hypothetical protein